jgi:TATA-box binding protein (TBP) (component of TFIID and TFIIIB)
MRKRTYTALDASVWGEDDLTHEDDSPVPVCHNIVSTSQIECSSGWIDLNRVALLLPNSRYDRKRFAAITIRIHDPTCTGLLFSSGKLVITGSVSMYACILAAHTISQLLRESDQTQDFRIVSCVVQNIVAHAEIPPAYCIDVDTFYTTYCEYATYQKTVFPGIFFVFYLSKLPLTPLKPKQGSSFAPPTAPSFSSFSRVARSCARVGKAVKTSTTGSVVYSRSSNPISTHRQQESRASM